MDVRETLRGTARIRPQNGWKKAAACILTVLLIAVLTGCGQGDAPAEDAAETAVSVQKGGTVVERTETGAAPEDSEAIPAEYEIFFSESGADREEYIQERMVELLERRQALVNNARRQMTDGLNAFFLAFDAEEYVPPEPIDVGRDFLKDTVSSLTGTLDSPVSGVLEDVANEVIDSGGNNLWDTVSSTALDSIGSRLSESVREAVFDASGLNTLASAVNSINNVESTLEDILDDTPDYALALTLRDAMNYAKQVTAVLDDPNAEVPAVREAALAYNQFCAYRRAALDLRDKTGLTLMSEPAILPDLAEAEAIDRALGIYTILLREGTPAHANGDWSQYAELSRRWETLPSEMDAVKTATGAASVFEYAVPPNYDRECLNHLQSGNKAASAIWGALGGSIGSAFGGQLNNMSQDDVGKIHTAINGLNDEINAAVQQAEQSRSAYQADGFLLDQVYDPNLAGAGLESQIRFLNQMYCDWGKETEAAMLHDAAFAALTLRYAGEIYAVFLSGGTERDAYLELLDGNKRDFEAILSSAGVTAEECLEQTELEGIYQRTAQHHRQLGELVQSSQVWLDAQTMQTPLLSTGSGMVGSHKMLITWRTTGQQMRYATDPKGGVIAFYGFDRNGAPLCFVRGEDIILFDSDGGALYSTYSESKGDLLYKFARFLQENKNGFRKTEYDRYQSVY